ncbi:alpha/beta hydrolase [Sphingomonas sp.]|uniref:alpha/beta hydrolase n=1 Tax=Sphingomonas sp. TaxID=28214 RepID=UPI002DD65CB6|nr:alpha/beta hydrolase [Sphingomonas sp.]
MSIAIAGDPRRFSIITIAEGNGRAPAWTSRLHWPRLGDDHLALEVEGADERAIWAARLDDAVLRADRAVLLVAEGLGCVATSWWARLSPRHYVDRVAGAVLIDPADASADRPGGALFASPDVRLPFASVVLDGRGDGSADALVASWGSQRLAGTRQRTRVETPWRQATRLIGRLTSAVVERDVARARALRGLRLVE